MKHYKFKSEADMVDGEMVAGVCYAAAAEDLIKMTFDYANRRSAVPTAIGYLVKAEDDEDEMFIPEPDDDRGYDRGYCGDECQCWAPDDEEVDE